MIQSYIIVFWAFVSAPLIFLLTDSNIRRKMKTLVKCMVILLIALGSGLLLLIKVFTTECSESSNPHNFDVTCNPKIRCEDYGNLLVLIVIYSAPSNWKQRDAIRRSYANSIINVQTRTIVRFFVGLTPDSKLSEHLLLEFEEHDDIVQQTYQDGYYDLPLKAIGWMEWVVKFCPQPAYVYKTNDDVLVNSFYVKTFLEDLQRRKLYNDGFICRSNRNVTVSRYLTSRMFTSKSEYGEDAYPDYCDGRSYVIRQAVVSKLQKRSVDLQLFRLEDLWTSGFLRRELGIPIYDISEKFIFGNNNGTMASGRYLAASIATSNDSWRRTWDAIASANNYSSWDWRL